MAVPSAERVPHCPACGYCLVGVTSARCPECGRGFCHGDDELYVGSNRHWDLWAAAFCVAAWCAPFAALLLKPRDYPIFNPATPGPLFDQVRLLAARALYWSTFALAFGALVVACARLTQRLRPSGPYATRRQELSSFVLILIVMASAACLSACTWLSFIHDFD